MSKFPTLSRADLARTVQRRVGHARQTMSTLVDDVLQEIADELVSGGEVKISSFANFKVRQKAARVGRNPKTGEEVIIAPRRSISFSPSAKMRKRVAEILIRSEDQ
ncbi:MAG: integration host factor subunit alpha [Alphaproteobacteria bacterium]|nr:integration host factor subunit alpha [Alphaproteobacteria bacterium]